jgi:hypothetical protein
MIDLKHALLSARRLRDGIECGSLISSNTTLFSSPTLLIKTDDFINHAFVLLSRSVHFGIAVISVWAEKPVLISTVLSHVHYLHHEMVFSLISVTKTHFSLIY